ncbi:MAG: hypothetical protein OWU33_14695 [Firmicutes bacterium]|nr:hypothetical protein [Bacillota bacterium]
MVYRRLSSEAANTRQRAKSTWRANPWGLGRLITTCATVALLTLGRGFWWWMGFLLLSFILLALARPHKVSSGLGAVLAALLDLALWHLHIIPLWTAALFFFLTAVEFLLSRAASP